MNDPASATHPIHVLLIEDEADYAKLVADMLHAASAPDPNCAGFVIQHAATLADGLRQLTEAPPHIVLLDLNLTDSRGFATFRSVQERCRDAPIVILSGLEDEHLALQTVQAGAQDYLAKSQIHARALVRVITYAVGRHSKRRQAARDDDKLREIIERSTDGIVIVNREGTTRYVNPAGLTLFGHPIDEMVGEPFGLPVLADEKKEVDIPRRGGDSRIAELRVADLYWEGEAAYLVTLRDVTERRQLEEHLRQSQAMEGIGRLAGGVAHEFNNLLTTILGFAQFLEMEMEPDNPLQNDVAEIRKAGKRAAAITKQLQAFSRPKPTKASPLNLNVCVTSMERMFTQTLGPRIELVTDLEEPLWSIGADQTQMEQVIMNLVLNARDAMEGEGRLEIHTRNVPKPAVDGKLDHVEGAGVVLRVKDSGCGIPPDVIDRVFDPNFTTKEDENGTGLGLSIVDGIVKHMGGVLEVQSKPGQGAEFQIFVPAVVQPDSSKKRKEQPKATEGAETILLVEDEDAIRQLASRFLQMRGYNVLEARHGGAALDIADLYDGRIDLVLTDVVMPHLNGSRMVERLEKSRSDFKVLFMSGFTHRKLARHDLCIAHHRLLAKPYSLEELAAAVRDVLDDVPAAE